MAFSRLVLSFLVLSVAQCFATVHVPVYMWGDLPHQSLRHSAIGAVPFREFGVILKQELQDEPLTVVFVEENLSVEDLTLKTEGVTAFPFLLSNVRDSVYLPSVESPLRVLNKFADPEKVKHVKLTENGLSADIETEGGNYLFINLKDAKEGESRYELLRRHNDFMEEMFTKLQERYNKVVAIYTAHYPSWTVPEHSRVRRDVASPRAGFADLSLNGLRIVIGEVTLSDGTKTVSLKNPTRGDSEVNTTTMASTIHFSDDNNVTLNFASAAGYWNLESVLVENPTLNAKLKPEEGIYALEGFSYHCSLNLTFYSFRTRNDTTNPTRSLTFHNIQVQPYFVNNDTNLVFGDHFDCGGYFTAPIWAGILIVALLLSITFYGIMMMMDINTMDQFDDPKGKTITINAND